MCSSDRYFVLRKITESFRDKDYQVQRTELYFLIVPGLVGLLICVLLDVYKRQMQGCILKLNSAMKMNSIIR